MIKDYQAAQNEMNKMGFFQATTIFGTFVYFDKEMYEEYQKQKVKDYES